MSMFKTIAEYEDRLEILRAEKEGCIKAADDVDNNIKVLEAERDKLASKIKADEEFANGCAEGAHQIRTLYRSFTREGFDADMAKQLTILLLTNATNNVSVDPIMALLGGN